MFSISYNFLLLILNSCFNLLNCIFIICRVSFSFMMINYDKYDDKFYNKYDDKIYDEYDE